MQARKHALPALPESFFTCGVAMPPPGFGGTCEAAGATLAMEAPNLPAPPPQAKGEARPGRKGDGRKRYDCHADGAIHERLLNLEGSMFV